MIVEVIFTNEFEEWWDDLDEPDQTEVAVKVDLLEIHGVTLGYPESSKVEGTKYNMRELRIQSRGRPIRVFYSFDPKRQAVLLIGGEKRQGRFYKEMIPVAERIWEEYLQETVLVK